VACDSLQRVLDLGRMKRLGYEGDAAQLKWQLILRRARNKNKRHMLALKAAQASRWASSELKACSRPSSDDFRV
jgi:hypothetical protein